MENVKYILTVLEASARGKVIDDKLLLDRSRAVYHWATELEYASSVDREQAVTTTIQLYNKARLLSSPNLMEVKVYLKASAAWMLTAYGGNKFKSMVSCIKLHCRSATELILYFPDDFIAAHSSLLQAIKNWTFVNNQAIERMISVVELEELRLYMFHCYVSLGRLQMKSNCKLLDDFKISLSAAMELVQSLPEMQFVFIEHAIAVGYYLSTHGFTLDSVPYFSRAISRIDMLIQCTPLDAEPEANQIRGHSWTIDDLNASKAKAYLSLAYIYSDLMKPDQAIHCIDQLEKIPNVQEDLFLFAKFSVACLKGGDFEYEAYAKRIISCTTGYRIAIDALNMFCSFVPDFSGWAEMYDHILKAFPCDPDYTNSRLTYLGIILKTFRQIEADRELIIDFSAVSYALGKSIIDDHLSKSHILGEDPSGQRVVIDRIVNERVAWYRNFLDFTSALKWINLALILPSIIDADVTRTAKQLVKAQLLTDLNRHEEAFQIAHAIAQDDYSKNSLLMVFKCALLARCPEEASRLVINCQRKHILTLTNNVPENYDLFSRCEDLDIFLICCKEAFIIKHLFVTTSILLLLEEWINQYLAHKLWKYRRPSVMPGVAEDTEQLLPVLFEYIILSLSHYTKHQSFEAPLNTRGFKVNPKFDNDLTSPLSKSSELPHVDEDEASDIAEVSFKSVTSLKRKFDNEGSCDIIAPLKSPKLGVVLNSLETSRHQYIASSSSDLNDKCGIDNADDSSHDMNKDCLICPAESNFNNMHSFDDSFSPDTAVVSSNREIWLSLVSRLNEIISIYRVDEGIKLMFGFEDELQNIADLCWNIGKAFLPKEVSNDLCDFDKMQSLILSSFFFELASAWYSLSKHCNSGAGIKNRLVCQIAALAERLDSDAFLRGYIGGLDVVIVDKTRIANVNAIHVNFRELKSLFSARPDDGEAISDLDMLHRIFIMLEFSCRCRSCDIEGRELSDFLNKNEATLLSLSAADLELCSEICLKEKNGTLDVSRRLLLISVQKCIQKNEPDWCLIFSLYRKAIRLSSSRQEAFRTIVEVEQLISSSERHALSTEVAADNKTVLLNNSDIDEICAITYNWGITLLELGQFVLAEKFISKTIQMLKHTTSFMLQFQDTIQEAYSTVLENINICQKGETSFPNDLSSLVNLSGNCKDELIVTQLVLEKSETALNMQQLLN